MAGCLPFAVSGRRLRLAVRLTPKSAADRIIGVVADGHGGWALKAAVTAAPVDGKANAALVKLLARAFGLRQGDLALVAGAGNRSKLIELDAAFVPVLQEKLQPWLKPG